MPKLSLAPRNPYPSGNWNSVSVGVGGGLRIVPFGEWSLGGCGTRTGSAYVTSSWGNNFGSGASLLQYSGRLILSSLSSVERKFEFNVHVPVHILPLLEVLVLRVRIRQIIVLVLSTFPAAQVAGHEADQQSG